jgi:hypothetical protein
MLPVNTYTFEYPDVLNDTQGVQRLHNKVGKEALRKELVTHQRKRIPGHFEATNRAKYSHMPRKEGYKYYKYRRFRSRTDLVATGRTKDAMTRMYQIRIGGTASGETGLKGQLILRFPFTQTEAFRTSQKKRYGKPVEQRRQVVGVTIEQMRKEISTIIADEQREIAQSLGKTYAQDLNKELASRPRLKKYFK